MIYKREESEVQVLGEVEKFKVSIDEKNINHIVTILSSNLYSHPMESFLRETVSNAIDSHIEAGTKEPIIITRTDHDISIRDFGTGISPERFKETYIYIGSSTKRDTNKYIGHFGIGKYSALAVADIANITSFYNGKAYYYVMNKDIDQLHIDLLFEKDTDEKNGVEVKVPLTRWDPHSIDCLAFIENVYIDSEVHEDLPVLSEFNKRKIYSYKNFKITNLRNRSDKTYILLGKIPYEVDYKSLWDDDPDYTYYYWKDAFKTVFPQIQIGEIDITPNREGLLYSEKTKEVLRKAYNACIEELTELWDKQCEKEYDDIKDYMLRVTSYTDNRLILNNITVNVPRRLPYKASYKKHKEWDNLSMNDKKELISHFLHSELDLMATMEDNTLYQGRRQSQWFTLKKLLEGPIDQENVILALPSRAGFSSIYFKDFLNKKYGPDNKTIIRQLPRHYLSSGYIKNYLNKTFSITFLASPANRHFIFQLIKETLKYLEKRIFITDIIGSPEYEQYKKEHATKKSKTIRSTEKICFTVTYIQGNHSEKHSSTVDGIIPLLRNEGSTGRIVYAELDNPIISALNNIRYPNLVVLSVAKGKMNLIRRELPQWVRPIEELYSEDNRVLQKYAACKFIREQPEISFGVSMFPKIVRERVAQLSNLMQKYSYNTSYGYYSYNESGKQLIDIVPLEKYNTEIMALWHQTEKYLKIAHKLGANAISTSYPSIDYYFLMKAKKLRIRHDWYCTIKESINKILNVL